LKLLEKFLNTLIARLIKIHADVKSSIYFNDFESRDTDIYVSTFLKSGTTWMQMILYQMLTDGSMDFNHIYDVSPWISNEATKNLSAERVNQLPNPRIIKSHDPYKNFDPNFKGKIIHVYREGKDVAVSLFHHRKNYNNSKETLKDTFDKYFTTKNEYNWFSYNKDWFENKSNLSILYISYEDLKTNFLPSILKIAAFLGQNLTKEQIERITERSSFDFMKKHEDKFGEQKVDKRIYNQFIRKGESGEGNKELNEMQKKQFDLYYKKFLAPFKNKLS